MATSGSVLQSYLLDAFSKGESLDYTQLLERNREKKGGNFLTPLSFYLGILDGVDKVMLPFMSEGQKAQLKHDLQVTLMLLQAEGYYESRHQKTENKKNYAKNMARCRELLDALNPEIHAVLENAPEQEYFVDGRPVKYCGIPLAKEFADKLVELADHKAKTLKDAMGALNEKRLYWVWASAFLKTVLGALPEDFFNSKQAGEAVRTPDPYTGTLSWALYYFRFSFNLCLLLKHTIKGPWMDAEEAATPWYERFQTQWAQRKFSLLNDSLWGTANLLCFFWLNGKSALGAWGDAITIGLLVFDVSVALWDFAEQQTAHNKQMLQFTTDIEALENERKRLMAEEDDNENRRQKIMQIDMQLNALKREEAKCAREWNKQKINLYLNIAYAAALICSFTMLTMPFVAIPAATALSLGIAGAVLCFAFTVIANAIRGGIEIHNTRSSLKETQSEISDLTKRLRQLYQEQGLSNETKFLYLQIKQLSAETEYQKQIVFYQSMNLVRSIIIESLIPAAVFACFVFLPLGIGIAALGGALGLAIATSALINALCKPDESIKALPTFNERECQTFCTEFLAKDEKEHYAFFKQQRKISAAVKHEEHIEEEMQPLLEDKKNI